MGNDLRPTAAPDATPIPHPRAERADAIFNERRRENEADRRDADLWRQVWPLLWAWRIATDHQQICGQVLKLWRFVDDQGPPKPAAQPGAAREATVDELRIFGEALRRSASTIAVSINPALRAQYEALHRAAWVHYEDCKDGFHANTVSEREMFDRLRALGPPPDEPEPTAAATPDLDRVRPSQEGGSGSAATPPTGTCNCLDAPEHGCPVHHLQAGEVLR